MRLILDIISSKTISQKDFDEKYHNSLHGFIYKKLGVEEHENKISGEFCFGNLFPIKNNEIREKESYKIVISTPKANIIEKLFFSLKEGETINLGEGSFQLVSFNIKNVMLRKNSILENLTPINITSHKDGRIISIKYEDEGFLTLLRNNLVRKYNYLCAKEKIPQDYDLFKNVEINPYEKKKEASFPIFFYNKQKNKKFDIIGSKLVFKFNNVNDEQLRILQCCFDAGFGERTTYGAGFMVERWKK